MNKNAILLVAVGGAVLLVLQKQAQAANARVVAPGQYVAPRAPSSVNMNGDMWQRLLGEGWRNLTSAQNPDGSAAFLKNVWGQITTSDGKPVSTGDPVADYQNTALGLPVGSYGAPDYLGMISPLDDLLDGGGDILGW